MKAELGRNNEKIIVWDAGTYDLYVSQGWTCLSITEEKEMAKVPPMKKGPMKPGRKGGGRPC